MPTTTDTHVPFTVKTCTSEAEEYPASLLEERQHSKHEASLLSCGDRPIQWLTDGAVKKVTLTLSLGTRSVVRGVSLVNGGATIVEILAGRNGTPLHNFHVLLPPTCLVPPKHARSHTPLYFTHLLHRFTGAAAHERWDVVMLVLRSFTPAPIGLCSLRLLAAAPKKGKLGAPPLAATWVKGGSFTAATSMLMDGIGDRARAETESLHASDCGTQTLAAGSVPSARRTSRRASSRSSPSVAPEDEAPSPAEAVDPMQVEETAPETVGVGKKRRREVTKKRGADKNGAAKDHEDVKVHALDESAAVPFNKLLDGVVLVISGIQNPERSHLRDKATAMGAKYLPNWSKRATHLICEFVDTPKYIEAQKSGGEIVTREWLEECHRTKARLDERDFRCGGDDANEDDDDGRRRLPKRKARDDAMEFMAPWIVRVDSDEEDAVDVEDVDEAEEEGAPKPKRRKRNPTTKKTAPAKATAVKDEVQAEESSSTTMKVSTDGDDDGDDTIEMDIVLKHDSATPSDREKMGHEGPLESLGSFLSDVRCNISLVSDEKLKARVKQLLVAYGATIDVYVYPSTTHIVTDGAWCNSFYALVDDMDELEIVKPQWVLECHKQQKCVNVDEFIVPEG